MSGNEEVKLSWTLAKSVLSEPDRNRLACCFFHFDSKGKIDYNAAAADFGAASPAAMRVGVHTALSKLKKASGIRRPASKAGSAPLKDEDNQEDIGIRKRKRGVSARGRSGDGDQNATRNAKARRSGEQDHYLNGRKSSYGKGEDPEDDDASANSDQTHATKIKPEPDHGAEDLGSFIVP